MPSLLYFNAATLGQANGLEWDTSTALFQVLLTSVQYVPDPTQVFVSQVTNELNGTGYMRLALSSRSVRSDNSRARADYLSEKVLWSAINAGTAAWAIIIKRVNTDSDSLLVAAIDLRSQTFPNGFPTNGGPLELVWNGDDPIGIVFSVYGGTLNTNPNKFVDRLANALPQRDTIQAFGALVKDDPTNQRTQIDLGRVDVREFFKANGVNDPKVDDCTAAFDAADTAALADNKHVWVSVVCRIGSALTMASPVEFAPRGRGALLLDSSNHARFFATYPVVVLAGNTEVHTDWFVAASDTTTSADAIRMRHAVYAAPNKSRVVFDAGDFDLSAYDSIADPNPSGLPWLIDLVGRKHLELVGKGARLKAIHTSGNNGCNADIFGARGCYHITFDGFECIGNFTDSPWLQGQELLKTDNQLLPETLPTATDYTVPIGDIAKRSIFVPFATTRDDNDYEVAITITKAGGAASGSDTIVDWTKYQQGFILTVAVAPGAQNIVHYQVGVASETSDLTIRNCKFRNWNHTFRIGPATRHVLIENIEIDGGLAKVVNLAGTDVPSAAPMLRRMHTRDIEIRNCKAQGSVIGGRSEGPGGVVSGSDDFLDTGGHIYDVNVHDNVFSIPGTDTLQTTCVASGVALYDNPSFTSLYRNWHVHHNTFTGFGGGLSGFEYTGAIIVAFFYGNGDLDNVVFEDNILVGSRNGMYISGHNSVVSASPLTVRRNKVLGCRTGITVRQLPGAVVDDNQVGDCTADPADTFGGSSLFHAVKVTGQGTTCRGNRTRTSVAGSFVTQITFGDSADSDQTGVCTDNHVDGSHASQTRAILGTFQKSSDMRGNRAVNLQDACHGLELAVDGHNADIQVTGTVARGIVGHTYTGTPVLGIDTGAVRADTVQQIVQNASADNNGLALGGDVATRERQWIGDAYATIGKHFYRQYEEAILPASKQFTEQTSGSGSIGPTDTDGTGLWFIRNGASAGFIVETSHGGPVLGLNLADAVFLKAQIAGVAATDYDFTVGYRSLTGDAVGLRFECGVISGSPDPTKYALQVGSSYLQSTIAVDANFHIFRAWHIRGSGLIWFQVDSETPLSMADTPITGFAGSGNSVLRVSFNAAGSTQRNCYFDSALWAWHQVVGRGGT